MKEITTEEALAIIEEGNNRMAMMNSHNFAALEDDEDYSKNSLILSYNQRNRNEYLSSNPIDEDLPEWCLYYLERYSTLHRQNEQRRQRDYPVEFAQDQEILKIKKKSWLRRFLENLVNKIP